jgi:molybdopterin converting factor small subunit
MIRGAWCVIFRSAKLSMQVTVQFHSYFKELTGCAESSEMLPDDATLGSLHDQLMARFPKLAAMKKSTLLAVGVDYQTRDYVLKDGDEVSLFPPVQGG